MEAARRHRRVVADRLEGVAPPPGPPAAAARGAGQRAARSGAVRVGGARRGGRRARSALARRGPGPLGVRGRAHRVRAHQRRHRGARRPGAPGPGGRARPRPRRRCSCRPARRWARASTTSRPARSRSCCEHDPLMPEARRLLGLCYAALGRHRRGARDLWAVMEPARDAHARARRRRARRSSGCASRWRPSCGSWSGTVTDDIRALTARLADEPGSLAFLELARGAAPPRASSTRRTRWRAAGWRGIPASPTPTTSWRASSSDQGDLAGAFDAWTSALQLDPDADQRAQGHRVPLLPRGDAPGRARAPAARARGRSRRRARSAQAHRADRRRGAVGAAAARRRCRRRVTGRASRRRRRAEPADQAVEPLRGRGRRRARPAPGRRQRAPAGRQPRGRRTAATRATASRPSSPGSRARRRGPRGCSGSGRWHSIAVESPDGHLVLAPPTADTVLLAAREPSLPMARVSAARRARRSRRPVAGWRRGHDRRRRPRSTG